MATPKRTCSIPDCERVHYARTWCALHYKRWSIHGAPVPKPKKHPIVGVDRRCSYCKETKDLSAFAKNQGECRECRKRHNEAHYSQGRKCADCGTRILNQNKYGWCRPCYQKNRRDRNLIKDRPGWHRNAQGYIVLSGQYGHPNAWKERGLLLEHVKVMSEMMGRPLRAGETVHHKNGVRDDNRPENLELWSRAHPPGQRVGDLVEWAREILDLYEHEYDKLKPVA